MKHTGIPALIALLATATASAQGPLAPGFEVTNTARVAITQVFAKPDGSPNWGSPLPVSRIEPGATRSVEVPTETNCIHDVRLVFANGQTRDHEKVNVCKHDRFEST